MKTIRPFETFGTRGLILIFAATLGVSIGVGFASPAFAQAFRPGPVIVNPDGKVTYLGTLGGSYSEARGINDSGQVVGVSVSSVVGSEHAFITGPDGMGMTGLGTLGGHDGSSARGINDSGQVVGLSYIGNLFRVSEAFITGPDGMGMTGLGTLGGASSGASGINDSGQVVGLSDIGDPDPSVGYEFIYHAFITGPNGVGMRDLGTLGGSYSWATGINDSGQVVGWSYTTTTGGGSHAFITGPDGMGMTDLGTLGGAFSGATGINDSGQVVGESGTTGGGSHAFITGPNGMGMTDLGTLGGASSGAFGINDSGQVVGESDTTGGERHAFITGPGGMGMTDLNSIADLPDGVYLNDASGINNQGQVIAYATIVPEPASYALMLAGLGLVGFMARGKELPGNSQSALS